MESAAITRVSAIPADKPEYSPMICESAMEQRAKKWSTIQPITTQHIPNSRLPRNNILSTTVERIYLRTAYGGFSALPFVPHFIQVQPLALVGGGYVFLHFGDSPNNNCLK